MSDTRKSDASGLTVMQKLEAINWAAKRAGSSYGEFSSTLTTEESQIIFSEYEKILDERKREDLLRIRGNRKTEKNDVKSDDTHTREDSP